MKNKKLLKKIAAVAAAIAMAAGLGGAGGSEVFAAGSQPDTGTITVHKYARSTAGVADPNNINSGEQLNAATEASLGAGLNGAGFTLWRLDMTAVDTAIANGNGVTGYAVNYSANTPTGVTFTLDGTGSPAATTAVAAFDTTYTHADLGAEKTTQTVSGTDGIAEFGSDDLKDGYYLLVETTVPTGYSKSEDTVITLPLTLNNGSDFNRDIHVYPKNIDSTYVTKEFTGNSGVLQPINTGDLVPFKITAYFKNNLSAVADKVDSVVDLKDGSTYGSAVIRDTLAADFSYTDSGVAAPDAGTQDFTIYLIDGAGSRITGAGALAAADYTAVGFTAGTLTPAAPLVASLTNSGIDKAIANNAAGFVIEFDTRYTGTASASAGSTATTAIKNDAVTEITKAGGTTPTTPPGATESFPKAEIQVNKFKEDGTTALAGVTFALCKAAVPTIDYKPADFSSYSAAQKSTLLTEYVCDANGQPISAVTDSTGNVIFNNVPYVDAGKDYYLKEIITVAGYQLKTTTIAVHLDSKAELTTASSALIDADGSWVSGATVKTSANITNYPLGTTDPDNPAFSLPLTGGAGTIMFTVIGIVVMLGAAFFYLRSRKKA